MEQSRREWEKERQEAIKKGVFRPHATMRIRLALTNKEINEHIKKEKLDYLIGWWGAGDLKEGVYLKKVRNSKDELKAKLRSEDVKMREDFPKLFWEEYVYKYDFCSSYHGYHKFQERAKYLNEIKKFLDRNKKYHGLTGEELQDSRWKLKGFRLNFSWRGWGALMSAYMNSKIKKREYNYMSFYM